MKLSKSPTLIFLSITANLKTIELIAVQRAAKTELRFYPKNFFPSFSCWDDLIMFFKPKKNFMKKSKKKNFSVEIDLQFFAAHWSALNYSVFRLARFDRRINGVYFDSFIEKIRWEEHLYFYEKMWKTSKLGRSGTARILPMPAPMG